MNTRYKVLTIATTKPLDSGVEVNSEIYASTIATFHNEFEYQLDKKNHIKCLLRSVDAKPIFTTLEDAKAAMDTNVFQIVVAYDENSKVISAIHDGCFAKTAQGDLYKTEMNYLNLKTNIGQDEKIYVMRLNESIAYGYLRELVNNNSGDPALFKRGLGLGDYLYNNPPKQTYHITKMLESTNDLALHFFQSQKEIKPEFINNLKRELEQKPEFPVINLDNFNEEDMRYALENFGSFELVGSSMDKLRMAAELALGKCKEILDMPVETLEKVKQEQFHGFQNVREETMAKHAVNKDIPIRNQMAYHFKPYLAKDLIDERKNPRLPEGINMDAYREYYEQAHALLHTLYRKIAILFKVDPDKLINYLDDRISVLTTRKYFEPKEGEVGIPAHSDYGLLTLVVSDQPGLEVERDSKWIPAPAGPGLRFFINFGDWFGFQLKNIKCTAGYHRVEKVSEERHMLAFFLNPDPSQKTKVPKGQEIEYIEYLRSDKTAYSYPKKKM